MAPRTTTVSFRGYGLHAGSPRVEPMGESERREGRKGRNGDRSGSHVIFRDVYDSRSASFPSGRNEKFKLICANLADNREGASVVASKVHACAGNKRSIHIF